MDISTWELIRTSGLTAFFMLFLSVVAGLLLGIKAANPKTNQLLQIIHQSTGWLSFLFGLFHGLLLYIDHYQPFSLIEIFIPFMAKEHSILNGLGTISLYIIVLLFLSADMMKKIGKKAWKWVHRLAFPLFVFICLHGILLGTDTKEMWGVILYTSSIMVVTTLLIIKLFFKKQKEKIISV